MVVCTPIGTTRSRRHNRHEKFRRKQHHRKTGRKVCRFLHMLLSSLGGSPFADPADRSLTSGPCASIRSMDRRLPLSKRSRLGRVARTINASLNSKVEGTTLINLYHRSHPSSMIGRCQRKPMDQGSEAASQLVARERSAALREWRRRGWVSPSKSPLSASHRRCHSISITALPFPLAATYA